MPASPEINTTWPSALLALDQRRTRRSDLFVPPDHGRQTGRMKCLEAALYRARPQHRPGPYGPSDALEFYRAEVFELQRDCQEAFGCLRQSPRCLVRQFLAAGLRGWVSRRRSRAPALLRTQSDHRRRPDRWQSRHAFSGMCGSSLQSAPKSAQSRTYRAFGIVLMRLRIAEIHEHAIPMYFATKPSNLRTVSAAHF